MSRQPPELCSYIGHLPREQIRELFAQGRLRMCSPENPGWPLTESYLQNPPPPMRASDWGPSTQDRQRSIFRTRVMREGLEQRFVRDAQERAQQDQWACFPDPLVRLFMPQFKLMPARGFDSIQHTLDHVHLRIQEVAEALQAQARAEIPVAPLDLSNINLASPFQRACLAAFLAPIYARYEEHLHTREMEYLARLTSVKELQYRWLLLHRFLVEHGFSVASVEEFVGQQQRSASMSSV